MLNSRLIQNVGIEQAWTKREIPLTIDRGKEWFDSVLGMKLAEYFQKIEVPATLQLNNLDKNMVKKLGKTYLYQFEKRIRQIGW